jgi:hypothetical protein
MKRIIMLSTFVATMVVNLALAGSASAAKPEATTFHEEGTYFLADCGDFDVLTDFEEDASVVLFFDNQGNEDFLRVHEHFHDFFYNSVTGEGFAETDTVLDVIDLQSGTESLSGLAFHVTVPGEGVVLLDAGRLVADAEGNLVFEAGHHQIFGSNPDTEKLCAALAPKENT